MVDPKTLPESDPNRHTMQIRARLTELTEHLREDVQKVDDPSFKALFETTAEVLAAWKRHSRATRKRPVTPGASAEARSVRTA